MNCEFCHNKELAEGKPLIDEAEVFQYLKKRQGLIDAVVISGGEPTLQQGLVSFASRVKELGFLVKLDTNGTNPDMVEELIHKNLIDYIAMDIKTVEQEYEALTGINYDKVSRSEKLVSDFSNHEFRTTIYPKVKLEHIQKLCHKFNHKRYFIQQYRKNCDKDIEPYDNKKIKALLKPFNISLRNLD